MYRFKVKDYVINICQDIYEWGREFYDIHENLEIANLDELTSKSMGFANIEDKEIWVYIPDNNPKEDYRLTIAHEIGHIIEGGFKRNPAPRMAKLHEKKAEHYEEYFKTVMEIINHVETQILNKKH